MRVDLMSRNAKLNHEDDADTNQSLTKTRHRPTPTGMYVIVGISLPIDPTNDRTITDRRAAENEQGRWDPSARMSKVEGPTSV